MLVSWFDCVVCILQVRERLRAANERNIILEEELMLANQEVDLVYCLDEYYKVNFTTDNAFRPFLFVFLYLCTMNCSTGIEILISSSYTECRYCNIITISKAK